MQEKTVTITGTEKKPVACPETIGIKKVHQIKWENELEVAVLVVLDAEAQKNLTPGEVEIPPNGTGNGKVRMTPGAHMGHYKYSIELTASDGERVVEDPYIDVEEEGDG